MVINSISEFIGNTPLLHALNFQKNISACADLYVKPEYLNPTGSVKDRAAFYMLKDAIEKGSIKEGATVIEPTSGNTGIALASLCAQKKLRLILTMPETMSIERRKLLSLYGAEIVLTDADKGMQGSIDKAYELKDSIEGSFVPSQFTNPANSLAHIETTGPEIILDLKGNVDIFIATVGSGGTFSGTARYLKENCKSVLTVAVEPDESPMISKGYSGSHGIQGIGANFVPEIYIDKYSDVVETVPTLDAIEAAKEFIKAEGALVGISSGAALAVAKRYASKEEYKGKNIVVILPDSGDRYFSTSLFE